MLFNSYSLGDLVLHNRIVMAPMTRSRALDTVPNALMAEYYAQRATAGLIISEGTQISEQGRGYVYTPGIHTQSQIDGWSRVTSAVKNRGGRMFCQLWHVGRVSHVTLQPNGAAPVGPSDLTADATSYAYDVDGVAKRLPASRPRALTTAEAQDIAASFGRAARNARQAGFEGVELHGANGYLLEQFLNPLVNTRNDIYSGDSISGRIGFFLDCVDAAAEAIGKDRVGVRISPFSQYNGLQLFDGVEETYTQLISELSRRGITYLHLLDQATLGAPAYPSSFLSVARRTFEGTLIVCGGYSKSRGKKVIEQNLADLVAFGAPFISNPDLVRRLKGDLPLNAPREHLFYAGGGTEGYTDYPVWSDTVMA